KSITLYANWTINYYAVNAYHYDGNYENDTPSLLFTFTIEDEVMLPAQSEMIKPGYIFAGWYTDYRFSPLTQVIMIPKGTASHVNIYAKWVAA
ncbi:MAG: InlB B-repeat-containing protein, partial [Clostridiales bacterium]|nr:InlB B-repeat-containing protein [Clostridiales bacterium]